MKHIIFVFSFLISIFVCGGTAVHGAEDNEKKEIENFLDEYYSYSIKGKMQENADKFHEEAVIYSIMENGTSSRHTVKNFIRQQSICQLKKKSKSTDMDIDLIGNEDYRSAAASVELILSNDGEEKQKGDLFMLMKNSEGKWIITGLLCFTPWATRKNSK